MTSTTDRRPDRARISLAIRSIVVAESGLSLDPASLSEQEPLNGDLLKINSMAVVRSLMQLEDDLGITLSDDLFVGRSFRTVSDLIEVAQQDAEVVS
ncbi:acyl carrier protein [Streptomyces pharetrae]|uniref:acyl carrier protein n=1 Tax=Streptomyces pharetrae TaxID=291370 RepID=UPI0033608B87